MVKWLELKLQPLVVSATKVGTGAKFTINSISASTDTLYLTDVQGENFTNGEDIYFFNSGTRTDSGVNASADSTLISDEYSGNILKLSNLIMLIMVEIIRFKLLIFFQIPKNRNYIYIWSKFNSSFCCEIQYHLDLLKVLLLLEVMQF